MKYKSELNQLIIIANNTLKRKSKEFELELDKDCSGYRICNGYSFLSPRMSVKNLIIWLNGFIEGLDF